MILVGYGYLRVFLFWLPFGFISQRLCHLDILTKYQHLTGSTVLTSKGRFFDAFSVVDNWYPTFTYIPDQHWSSPHERLSPTRKKLVTCSGQVATTWEAGQWCNLDDSSMPFCLRSGNLMWQKDVTWQRSRTRKLPGTIARKSYEMGRISSIWKREVFPLNTLTL